MPLVQTLHTMIYPFLIIPIVTMVRNLDLMSGNIQRVEI